MAQFLPPLNSNLFNLFKSLIVLAAIFLPAWASTSTLLSLGRVSAIQDGSIDPLAHAEILDQKAFVAHPYEWTQTARILATQSPENGAVTISLLEAALSQSQNDAQAWALLAFVRKRQLGRFSPEAEQDLRQSFEACPYCSKPLLRWRLSFVLDNWNAASEDSRIRAFSGADFLRWWHLDYDYLAQVGNEARSRGIPFDQYRKKIDTPFRPNEIGLYDD